MSTTQIVQTAISAFGGIALLLFGMNVLGSGLEKISGGKMEKILEKLTSNIFKAVALGAVVTAVIQSSGATTVIVVGLVNSGILPLSAAVGIIMGANIGTTVTGQILRLGDLESNESLGTVMQFLTPDYLAPMLAVVGIIIILISKKDTIRAIGDIGMGLGVLFTGMLTLTASVKPLSELPAFREAFASLENPVLGILVGAVVTALLQSSSASVGILQAVSSTGVLTFAAAFPIIMGQNIGTCSTSVLSSIGATKNAKRAAMVHLYFNLIGTILFLTVVYILKACGVLGFWYDTMNMGSIANFHTLFNISVTAFFIPFHKLLEKLALITIRSKEDEDDVSEDAAVMLDNRFLKSPSLAIQYANNAAAYMGKLACKNFQMSCSLHREYDEKIAEKVMEYEDVIDHTEDRLNSYLVSITDCELSAMESKSVTSLLHIITDFERIGDYSMNIMQSAQRMHETDRKMSDNALIELKVIHDAIVEIIEMAVTAVEYDDTKTGNMIKPLEETIDQLEDELRSRHIERLKNGECAIDRGVNFLDMLSDIERIADHCNNVAYYVQERNKRKKKDLEVTHHQYKDTSHQTDEEAFVNAFNEFVAKYQLP